MVLCTLASGSSGNCTVVSNGTTHFLIDAGISARRIQAGLAQIHLNQEQITGILITHEHRDHVSGLGVFLKKNAIPVYASIETGRALLYQLPELKGRLHTFQPDGPFLVKDIEVTPFSTWHDTKGSVGYRLSDGKARVAVATDLGCITRQVADAIEGVDLLLLEANYDRDMLQFGPYPAFLKRRIESDHGHLSNDEAGRTAAWAAGNGTKTILLGHLSEKNNRPDRALETVENACQSASSTVCLHVAPRSKPSGLYVVGETNVEYTNVMCG